MAYTGACLRSKIPTTHVCLPNQSLRVHFNKDESLEHVLQIIKILIPGIEYEIADKNIYVK
ncbi:DUF4974 domain-containing protein [Bacteroides heparinolyticus]|uniref:DUF4974 domain-containing protein n=1 Tax=Prevotella heparinolytica TaxID=28113 RepID=UPI0035A14B8A